MNRKALAVLCSSALAVGGMFLLTGANSPTKAASFTGANQFSGYSTGTDVFADLLQSGPTPPLTTTASRVLNANVAFSGAAVNSGGLTPITNEMNMGVVPNGGLAIPPAAPARNTYARGSGLDAGIVTPVPNNPDVNQIIIAGLAEQAAPPQTPACTSPPQTCGPGGEIIKELGPVPGDPLVYADLLRGESLSQFNPTACDPTDSPAATGGIQDITKDLSFGLGRAAKVQLIDLGPKFPDGSMSKPVVSLEAPPGGPPQDTVAQSKSFTFLTPNPDGTMGLTSETMQSIAPVSLNLSGSILTIEIGGPWIMRATATGKTTGSEIHVGPADQTSPTTLLITLTPPGMPTQTILKTQTLFPSSGGLPQHIFIPGGAGAQLAEINIGEDPRAIGSDNVTTTPLPGPTVTPTNVSGALDVVRVKLLVADPVTHVSDIRVGHIEAQATVPSGGIDCGAAPVAASTTTTGPGGGSTTTGPGGGSTTTTGPGGGSTTTTGPGGGTTTTTANPGTTPGNTTTTSPGGGTTTTTANPGTTPGNTTPTTAATKPNNATTTTGPAQVQAVTFSQTPAATPQSQTPNFTG